MSIDVTTKEGCERSGGKWVRLKNALAEGYCDLSESDFSIASFRDSDFADSDLRGCDFNGADLTGAVIFPEDLKGACKKFNYEKLVCEEYWE